MQSIEVLDPSGGCVPQEVADAALAGAQAFWDAKDEFWDPADAEHPLIAQTTTGEYLAFTKKLVERIGNDGGRGVFGESEPNFRVIQVDSVDLVVLGNCYAPDPEYGWYTLTAPTSTDRSRSPMGR